MNVLRAFFRLVFFSVGSLLYVARYSIKASIVGHNLNRVLKLRQEWFKILIKFLGVKINTYGTIPIEPGLLVCNHRSYFDPVLILNKLIALPVGKIELASWPVIGIAARVSGTIFVDRKTKEGRANARKKILATLKSGRFVINFPEGTTHHRSQTLDFKPAMFRDAAAEGIPVYPVVNEYQNKADAWAGDDTFIRHFFECFGKKNTFVRLSYGPPLKSDSAEELMQKSKNWIDNELTRLRAGWHDSEIRK